MCFLIRLLPLYSERLMPVHVRGFIYLVLFVLQVAHKASTRACQRCRSAETRSRRPHVQPFSFISLSTVLLQVSLGRPLFLWPSGVHRRAILVKAVVCWRSTCPIHRQRLRLTWVEMGSISALRCSSSLVMVFSQYICRIRLRHVRGFGVL